MISPGGNSYEVSLYTTDGLRLEARGPGLDDERRVLEGALDLRAAMKTAPAGSEAELAELIGTRLGGRAIYEVWVQATVDELVVIPAQFFAEPMGTLHRTSQ